LFFQDDWLPRGDYADYLDRANELISSRRRIYPSYFFDYGSEESSSTPSPEGQAEEELHMRKKDLESLVYQAEPALAEELRPEPQISFRKYMNSGMETSKEATKDESQLTRLLATEMRRGMKNI
jgi:hypothetical protein